ncbi:MAG: glycosyltransferase family 2 protein [Pseudomonadota bacterium]
MTSASHTIAVIIVNYGIADLAIEAVESVLAQISDGDGTEVHLVDNASPGDDAAKFSDVHAARGWGPRVTLWLETVNHGFGRGNNLVLDTLAARDTPPDKVFLLNPDARLANDVLSILTDALEADAQAVAAGAGIVDREGMPATAAFRFPGFTSEVVKTIGFGPLDRLFSHRRVPLPPDFSDGRVDWVAGASVMFRFPSLLEHGFFDPAFFLYYEEVDLMRRLQAKGGYVLFVPEAQVIHHEGSSTNVRSRQARRARPPYVYESWRHYFSKSHGRAYAVATSCAVLAAAMVNAVLSVLRRKPPSTPKHFVRDHWRYALKPLLTGKAHAGVAE